MTREPIIQGRRICRRCRRWRYVATDFRRHSSRHGKEYALSVCRWCDQDRHRVREGIERRLSAVPIARAIRESDLSRGMVAELAGITDRSVRRIANGQSQVHRATAEAIADALDRQMWELYPEIDRR